MTSKPAMMAEEGYTFKLIQAKAPLSVDEVEAYMPHQSDDEERSCSEGQED